jgi:alpha-beta hydrolase superfamily lysophospholipase
MPWRAWPVREGTSVRAVVIAVHGLSGAASDFWPLGEALSRTGIPVYAYELRGQGNDPVSRERGHIRSRKQWLRDLETFDALVRKRHPGVPLFWHGASLGSLIVLHEAVRKDSSPDGLVLASPLAGIRRELGAGKRLIIELASVMAPRVRVRLGDLAGVDEGSIQVTKDTTHGEQMAKTPHHVESFSMRLLKEVGRLMETSEQAMDDWTKPLLVLASPQDVVASEEQIRALFEASAAGDKSIVWFKDSRHLLFHDVERDDVVQTEMQWLSDRL